MMNSNFIGEFPLNVLHLPLQQLIGVIQQETQAPIGLIASSVLGGMGLACQDLIDVQPKENLRHPVSLFMITLAESGERKSTVDKLLMKPVRKLEQEMDQEYASQLKQYESEMTIWQVEVQALKKALSKATEKGRDTYEFTKVLSDCEVRKPAAPMRKRLVLNDVTSAAIKQALGTGWPSIGLMSDEAGSLFAGDLLRDTPVMNTLWSGQPVTVERASSQGFSIEDGRLGLSLMVQPTLFANYLQRQGINARSSGFLARCLLCAPNSTQGMRMIYSDPNAPSATSSCQSLSLFHAQVTDYLQQSLARRKSGSERACLLFSPEASARWCGEYNHLESQLGTYGSLREYRDYASKFMEHVSRIAAVLEYFTSGQTVICDFTMYAAIEIARWYFEHFIQLMSEGSMPDDILDANILESWLSTNSHRWINGVFSKNHIRKYGPNRIRSKVRLDNALQLLERKGIVRIYHVNRTKCVQFFPVSFGL